MSEAAAALLCDVLSCWVAQEADYQRLLPEWEGSLRRQAYLCLSYNAERHPTEEAIQSFVESHRAELERDALRELGRDFGAMRQARAALQAEAQEPLNVLAQYAEKQELDCGPLLKLFGGSWTAAAVAKAMRLLQRLCLRLQDEEPRGQQHMKRPKKRGAPMSSDPEADRKLCQHWRAAKAQGATREVFARDRGISVHDLIGAQDREKYRRQRDAE